MYCENDAQAGLVFDAAADGELELEHAAISIEPETAAVTSAIRVRFARLVMGFSL